MYNRYIPQPDGSFRRRPMPDNRQPPTPNPVPTADCPPEPPTTPPPTSKSHCRHRQQNSCSQKNKNPPSSREDINAVSFLRRLLPKEFDTGDLMIVLLLLLIAGDCNEDQNTALLTLALYFLM